MAWNKLSDYKTSAIESAGKGMVQYHSTVIVEWTAKTITLRSGGWETVTTKRKMNQASHQFVLGFGVSQRDHVWYVKRPDGKEVPFRDGMKMKRESV